MWNTERIYIVIEPDGVGDFKIEASNNKPKEVPGLQYLKTITREYSFNPIKVYGLNVHIGDINFEQLDIAQWRFYQMINSRSEWA